MAQTLLQLTLQNDCENLYDKVDDYLSKLEPTVADLKKEVDDIVSQSYNFIDDVTDPIRATADEIEARVEETADLIGEIGNAQQSFEECYSCITPATENNVNSLGNKMSSFGNDISDLGDDGLSYVYELTQLPTDLTTTGYKIATDFLNQLNSLPETAIATSVAVLSGRYSPISSTLDQIDCWINCLANFCPDIADRVDGLLIRSQTIRDDIRMSEDGTLDVFSILEGSHIEFKKWANEVKTTINNFQSRMSEIGESTSKTLKNRVNQQSIDETGAKVSIEDTVSNVRASDMAKYGFPAGQDGEYQVTVDIISRNIELLFTYMEDLGFETKESLKSESAIISSLEEISVDGLKSKLIQDFLEQAPPEPRGKGDIPVKITVMDLFKTGRQTRDDVNLDWYATKSRVEILINNGQIRESSVVPYVVKSTDYSVYTDLLEEQFDESVSEMLNRVKNMVPIEAQELAPFIDSVINTVSFSVEDISKNFKL